MKYLASSNWKSNEVLIICLLAFLADMVGGIMSPINTLFALEIGASLSFIGLLTAVSSFVSLLIVVPAGLISDKIGRKKLILAGFILRLLAAVIYGLAPIPIYLLASVILQSIGVSIIYLNFRAYLADVTEPSYLGRVVSYFTTSMGIGTTIGPLIGGLSTGMWGYRYSYFLASFVSLIGLIASFFSFRSFTPSSPITLSQTNVPQVSRLFSILSQPRILWLSSMNIVSFTIMGLIMTYFPVLGKSIGFTPEVIGFIFFIRGLATTVIRIPTGILISKISEPILMILSNTLGVLGIISLTLTTNYSLILILMIIQGFSFGSYLTSSSTLLIKIIPSSERGTTLGLTRIFQGSARTINSYLTGSSAAAFGIQTTYLFFGSIMGIMLSIMVGLNYLKQIYKDP
ncbi:MFS transporter [Thermoproteota archaeon]